MDVQTDFLVIGSGVAGLNFALRVAQVGRVALVTKKEAMESNTNLAQGGIAAVLGVGDSFALHVEDTLASGAGLCHGEVVDLVVREGPHRIRELVDYGVNFSRNHQTDRFDLGREGGHSRNRIVHTADMTGREVERALLENARAHPNITFYEDHIAIDLLTFSTRMKRGLVTTTHEEHCCGAYVLDRTTKQVKTFGARIVLLATGGAGKVYLYTSNPDIATGDG
ncbi:MAG: FAD-binding protein, partial [Desulfobacterales bacterium]